MSVLTTTDRLPDSVGDDTVISTRKVKQLLAAVNHDAIEKLTAAIDQARRAAGRSMPEVSQILGIEPELAERIMTAEYELTTGELKEVLYAVDAVVDVSVRFNASAELRKTIAEDATGEREKYKWIANKVSASHERWPYGSVPAGAHEHSERIA